ncbi:metabolite traffic protein EboE [Kitasatospora sp. NBC_01539]|uniref:metabolite traffic protein EboE n=1 Tax=Kitasatospora sp. NBC_01539 TaxID=2903577 RepID=UPI0038601439
MRFHLPDPASPTRRPRTLHLGYCTNVHPAEDLPGIVDQLDRYAAAVRRTLDTPVLGVGLWLAAPVAAALAADPAARARLRLELTARGLEVVTLNGFPYQAFHAPVVKHRVYRPDWTTPERLAHTLNLAAVLADLLPDDAARGSVSTLPLAWRTPWDGDRADRCARALDQLAAGLAELERRTGRQVRVGFEPEPGCVVETTEQAAALLWGADPERIGICLDLAHLACAHEDPRAALARLAAAGLPVVKVQLSAALEVADPATAGAALHGWSEPRFLHQVRSPAGHGTDDLDEAVHRRLPGPWRVHYHVPLHADPAPPLRSTTPVLRAALDDLLRPDGPGCDHLEVETYTWEVLPDGARPRTEAELADGIAAELAWAARELSVRGAVPAETTELSA